MVGGRVIETIVLPEKVWVNVRDGEPRKSKNNECAIYVEKNAKSHCISEGDSLWWQGGFAMWTPAHKRDQKGGKCGVDYDIEIPRRGYSGVNRPEEAKP